MSGTRTQTPKKLFTLRKGHAEKWIHSNLGTTEDCPLDTNTSKMVSLQPVIINEGSVCDPTFSGEFILEFFRRYPEDGVMFPRGRTTELPYFNWKPEHYAHRADDTLVPGWTVYNMPYPSFLHKETGMWVHSHGCTEVNNEWRTDPRVIALVREMGYRAAGDPGANLRINYAPVDVKWWVEKFNDEGEVLHAKLPYERIIAELAGLLRKTEVGELHPYTRRILEEGVTLTDLEQEIYDAVERANKAEDM